MKQAKASQAEQDRLIQWLTRLEEERTDVPPWRRVVFGYGVLVDNCADPALDYLEFKPEIKAALAAKPAVPTPPEKVYGKSLVDTPAAEQTEGEKLIMVEGQSDRNVQSAVDEQIWIAKLTIVQEAVYRKTGTLRILDDLKGKLRQVMDEKTMAETWCFEEDPVVQFFHPKMWRTTDFATDFVKMNVKLQYKFL